MAIVVNSKFRPFSMDEMLKVVMPAAQMQKETEDALSQIDMMSSVWEKLRDSDIDKDVYQQYLNFQNGLNQSIDDVYKNGVNANTRRALNKMRSRYAKEITPIEEAWKKREEEVKEQYAGRANGMVYEGDASTTSLSRYMKNPSAKYRFANSQEGYKRLLNTATALAKELRSYSKTGRLDSYTKTWLQEFGYDSSNISQAINDIYKALAGDENIRGNNILTSILNQEMHTSGIMDWDNRNAQIDYFNRVSPALYQAIGQDKIESFADQGAALAAKEASEKRVAAFKYALEHPQPTGEPDVFTRHWEGIIGDGDFDAKIYDEIISKITAGGRGLSKAYSQNKDGSFINPMKIYEEVRKYAKEHPVYVTHKGGPNSASGYAGSVGARDNKIDISYNNALKIIKDKYGVSSILSENEYNALKGLGFSSSTGFSGMNGTQIYNAVNKKKQTFRASSVNMSDVTHPADIIARNMRGDKKEVYDIDEKKNVKYTDKDNIIIEDIAYSMKHKGKILVHTKEGRRQAVPASYYSVEAQNIVNAYDKLIEESVTDEQRAIWQDIASQKLKALFNSYSKIRSNTDSNI